METPVIAGAAGGVGTTTLAVALRALDGGIYRSGTVVDVLVARSTTYSLGRAQHAIAAAPEPPILAVVADARNGSMPGPAKARLRMTEPNVADVVMIPFVDAWRHLDNPHHDAAKVLDDRGRIAADLPRSLSDFAEALQRLIEGITPRVVHRIETQPPRPGPAGLYPPPTFVPAPYPAAWPGA